MSWTQQNHTKLENSKRRVFIFGTEPALCTYNVKNGNSKCGCSCKLRTVIFVKLSLWYLEAILFYDLTLGGNVDTIDNDDIQNVLNTDFRLAFLKTVTSINNL